MVWRDSKPTRVQTWWDSVDMERNLMDSTIFRERLHGVIVPWLLLWNILNKQRHDNIEYVPWSLSPCKWLCHRCHIMLRWTPLSTHLLIQVWWRIHFFLSVFLLLSLFSIFEGAQTSWKLRVTRALNRSRYILLPKLGPSLRGSVIYGGYPPISILVPGGHMVSELDFDWLLIFVYKWDVWVCNVTLSCPLVWASWDVVVVCAGLLLRNRRSIKFVSFVNCIFMWILRVDACGHRVAVYSCTVPVMATWWNVYQRAVIVAVQTCTTFLVVSYWKRMRSSTTTTFHFF